MSQIIHKDLSYLVRGVLIEVHKKLGSSLSEKFYQEAITNFFRGQEVDLQVVQFLQGLHFSRDNSY